MSKKPQTLQAQVIALMAAQGVSRRALARRAEITAECLGLWLNGLPRGGSKPKGITTTTLKKIVEALGGPDSHIVIHPGDEKFFEKSNKRA